MLEPQTAPVTIPEPSYASDSDDSNSFSPPTITARLPVVNSSVRPVYIDSTAFAAPPLEAIEAAIAPEPSNNVSKENLYNQNKKSAMSDVDRLLDSLTIGLTETNTKPSNVSSFEKPKVNSYESQPSQYRKNPLDDMDRLLDTFTSGLSETNTDYSIKNQNTYVPYSKSLLNNDNHENEYK